MDLSHDERDGPRRKARQPRLAAEARAPLGGALSDRFGRRPALVVSLVGGGASIWVLGCVTRIPLMVVGAAVTGLLYEMYGPVVSATIADIVASEDRPRAYSLTGLGVSAGFSLLHGAALRGENARAAAMS